MVKIVQKAPVKKDMWLQAKYKKILIWALQIAGTLILSAIVAYAFFGGTVAQENSMSPTIQANDHVKINRMSYFLGSPKRGDVIAFYKDSEIDQSIQIKRVIGVPGDKIQIVEGVILINGEAYMEDKGFSKINHAGLADDVIELDSEEYFVLGDNRNNSEDSRFADMGNVLEENVIGRVWITTSPLSRFGFID